MSISPAIFILPKEGRKERRGEREKHCYREGFKHKGRTSFANGTGEVQIFIPVLSGQHNLAREENDDFILSFFLFYFFNISFSEEKRERNTLTPFLSVTEKVWGLPSDSPRSWTTHSSKSSVKSVTLSS